MIPQLNTYILTGLKEENHAIFNSKILVWRKNKQKQQGSEAKSGAVLAQSGQGWHLNCWMGAIWDSPQHKVHVQVVRIRE